MGKSKSENVKLSEEVLRGKYLDPFESLKLVQRLKRERAFDSARKLLELLRRSQVLEPGLASIRSQSTESRRKFLAEQKLEASERDIVSAALKVASAPNLQLRLAQEHALCTYKDDKLPISFRLESALHILEEVEGDLSATKDQETLGQAGAIYKRMWEMSGQKQNLERALFYYLRGYEQGIAADGGYTAINAAFVLDLLGDLEEREAREAGRSFETLPPRRRQANVIRSHVLFNLSPMLPETASASDWWLLVTVAEAYFGLQLYEKARDVLEQAAALPDISDWQYESTARQLITLARLSSERPDSAVLSEDSEAYKVLKSFLKEKIAGIQTTLAGKVGLSLSGGGFRAALFHIGVLAKLAELDMLRNIEVLSCVSAGSVVGAHYYLEVRNLLQRKHDSEITREDYINIVQRIERDFLAGVQRNLRTRLAAEWWSNVKTIFVPNYSRTERTGELLEEEIYSRVKDGGEDKPRWLNELSVVPKGENPETFTPAKGNWRRAAKVPILIINATTLNTGHNWQFTTNWMGEPLNSINPEIDRNTRLQGVYYEDAPEPYSKFRLGRAVAASLCPPWLFEPIVLDNLYPQMTVRLVDGIIHNIHGTTALLEQDCTVVLVSDATLQMDYESNPSAGLFSVPQRAVRISLDQQRARQYELLESRRRSSLLRGLMFLHLKKDLDAGTLAPLEASSVAPKEQTPSTPTSDLTSYGVRKDVQQRLANIRTDLDAFSDTEAYALMTSGYLMAGYEFNRNVKGYPAAEGERPAWSFLAIEEPMKRVGNPDFIKLLRAASSPLLKLWTLSPKLRFATTLALGAFLYWLLYLAVVKVLERFSPGAAIQSNGGWGWFNPLFLLLLMVLLGLIIFVTALVRKTKTPSQLMLGLLMSTVGWILARFYLHILDPIYLAKGRIKSWYNIAGARGADALESETQDVSQFSKSSVRAITEKISPSSTVGSINRLVDHSNSVEAVAELFRRHGYKVIHYPREIELNPLQLNLDLHASKDGHQVITCVRTRSDSPTPVEWSVASELRTAASLLAGRADMDAPEPFVESLLVLVDVAPHQQLRDFIEKVREGNDRVEMAEITSGEVNKILQAGADGGELDEIARRLKVFSGLDDTATASTRAVLLEGGAT